MSKFIRIATDVYAADRIENVDLSNYRTNRSIFVKLLNESEPFPYHGDYADIAYARIFPKHFIDVGGNAFRVSDIESIAIRPELDLSVVVSGVAYTLGGDIAQSVLEQLTGTVILDLGLNGTTASFILIRDIEWVNLNADFGGQTGIEIRVSTDGVDGAGNGITRKYTGDFADRAYEQIEAFAGTEIITVTA